jgi:hypothetical protein
VDVGPVGFGILPLLLFLITWIVGFLIGLLFIIVAARVATRAVLDDIDKDRRRRGSA